MGEYVFLSAVFAVISALFALGSLFFWHLAVRALNRMYELANLVHDALEASFDREDGHG